MSAAADAGGRREGRLFRLGMVIGHYFERWSVFANILVWIHITAGWWLPDQVSESVLVKSLGNVVVWGYLVGLLCEIMLHERNLCLRDLDDAPLLDPQTAVDKNRRRLRLYHNRRQHLVMILTGVAPVAILFAMTNEDSLPVGVKLVLTVLAVIGVLSLTAASRVQRTHRRLQPWCPYCHRPGDDDDDPVVAPEPDPVGTADR